MRTLNTILISIISVLSQIEEIPLKVYTAFQSTLLDVPIAEPTITVGVKKAVFNTSSVSAFSGYSGDSPFYCTRADIDVSANIYLPNAASGRVNFEVLSLMIFALNKSSLPISRIECGTLFYDNTLMCSVLPVTLSIADYIFKEE